MKCDILGLQINTETRHEILEEINKRIASGEKTFIVTPYSEFFYYAAKDFNFRETVNSATFALPDGISIQWLTYYLALPLRSGNYFLKIIEGFWQLVWTNFVILLAPERMRRVIPEKIPGSEFFWDLVALASKNKLSIFLLGGFGGTPEIVAQKITAKFPGIKIAGISNSQPEDPKLTEQINSTRADLLFVAFGPQRQESWIAQNLEALNIKLAIGVGGTFDYIAGKKPLPPAWIRSVGLEWFYRLFTQPTRFKRIWHAYVDLLKGALRYKVYMTQPFRKNVVGVIINRQNKIFVGRKNVTKWIKEMDPAQEEIDWWVPQGGAEKKESLEVAVIHEITEETGMQASNLKILSHAPEQYSYIWPFYFRPLFSQREDYRRKGQAQTFFFLRYSGDDSDIRLNQNIDRATGEVSESEWLEYEWLGLPEFEKRLIPMRTESFKIIKNNILQYLGQANERND